MRKTIKTLLIWVLFIGIVMGSPKVTNAAGDIKVLLEGQELKFDVPPQIIEGRTLLPLRAIFEALGLEVGWDDATRRITGIAEGKEIILKLDSKDAKVNGVDKILDVPAKAINGRTLVPVRFIAESLDMNVVWNQESKTVKISKDDIIEWKYEGYEGAYPHKEYERKYVNGVKSEETRYNGNNHEFGPETRVLSEKNNHIKISFERDNNLILDYKDEIKSKFEHSYYSAEAKLSNLYYNVETKKFRIDENNTVYDYSSKDASYLANKKPYPYKNELYIATIVDKGIYYATQNDYIYNKNQIVLKNHNYNEDIEYAKTVIFKTAMEKKEKQDLEFATNLKKELETNKNIPIKILESSISYNSIGTPEISLKIKNLSSKTIKAYEMVLYCYDDFNRPVNRFLGKSNRFDGISQDNELVSGDTQVDTWTLSLYDLTTQVKNIKITYIAFTDGSTWKAK